MKGRGSSSPSCALLPTAALQPHLTPQPHPVARPGCSEVLTIAAHPDLQTSSLLFTKHHSCTRSGWKQKPQKQPTDRCLMLHYCANRHRELL